MIIILSTMSIHSHCYIHTQEFLPFAVYNCNQCCVIIAMYIHTSSKIDHQYIDKQHKILNKGGDYLVVQGLKIPSHYLVLQHGHGGDINPVPVISNDNYRSLQSKRA